MVFVAISVQIGLELKNHPGLHNFLHHSQPCMRSLPGLVGSCAVYVQSSPQLYESSCRFLGAPPSKAPSSDYLILVVLATPAAHDSDSYLLHAIKLLLSWTLVFCDLWQDNYLNRNSEQLWVYCRVQITFLPSSQ